MARSSSSTVLSRLVVALVVLLLASPMAACGRQKSHGVVEDTSSPAYIPRDLRPNWDPIVFNLARGDAGYIPESYLPDVHGPHGERRYLGQHLPYVVTLDAQTDGTDVPKGFLALMWGDPEKGYVQHSQARRSEANNYEGHWFHWIRLRKATRDDAVELESSFPEWPDLPDESTGRYAFKNLGSTGAADGKNTVYLVALPKDVRSGDIVRVHGHCLMHGEYVDFVRIP